MLKRRAKIEQLSPSARAETDPFRRPLKITFVVRADANAVRGVRTRRVSTNEAGRGSRRLAIDRSVARSRHISAVSRVQVRRRDTERHGDIAICRYARGERIVHRTRRPVFRNNARRQQAARRRDRDAMRRDREEEERRRARIRAGLTRGGLS